MSSITIDCCDSCRWIYTPTIAKDNHFQDVMKHKKIDKAGIIFTHKDKILIIESYNKFLGFPKGRKEKYETLEQTAIRELREETGIHLSTLEGCVVWNIRNIRFFVIEVSDEEEKYMSDNIKILDNGEITGIGFVHRNCIQRICENTGSIITSSLKLFLVKN